MSETLRFEIRKREAPYPHSRLVMSAADRDFAWMIPGDMPEQAGQRRLAVEARGAEQNTDGAESLNKLLDEGVCEIEYSNKIKMIVRTRGNGTGGRFLLHNPGWGRKTRRKLWVIEKLRN